jgi:hypothetical protein
MNLMEFDAMGSQKVPLNLVNLNPASHRLPAEEGSKGSGRGALTGGTTSTWSKTRNHFFCHHQDTASWVFTHPFSTLIHGLGRAENFNSGSTMW